MSEPSFAAVRKAITDSYYDTRDEGGTMEAAADLAANRVLNLWSHLSSEPASTGLDEAWREAEAAARALPVPGQWCLLLRSERTGYTAALATVQFKEGAFVDGEHDSPAAALRALTARLSVLSAPQDAP